MFIRNPLHEFNFSITDQRKKMKTGKNIFNIGRSAKLDYEMLINNIKHYNDT